MTPRLASRGRGGPAGPHAPSTISDLLAGRFTVVDAETDSNKAAMCRVIELGYAHFDGGMLVEHRAARFNPGVSIEPGATAVHHICDADLVSCPSLGGCVWLLPVLLSNRLVGYNCRVFDEPVLRRELVLGFDLDVPLEMLAVYIFVAWHLRHYPSRKLAQVAERQGVRLVDAHSAAADAIATGQILVRLLRAGFVPRDHHAALHEQARLAAEIDDERARWGAWFYRDRQAPFALCVGRGDYCGKRIEQVDPAYFAQVLGGTVHEEHPLTSDAREVFERRARGELLDPAEVEARAPVGGASR